MTAPNNSDPSGALGPGAFAAFQAMTSDDAKASMTSSARVSISNAGNVHDRTVSQPLIANANQLGQTGTALTNHENRITKLEDGSQAAVFYTGDTWHKPSGFTYHKVILVGGGGGGQGGQNYGSSYGGQGGGQGGWYEHVYADSDLTLSSYAVGIGSGGLGAYSYYQDDFERVNSLTLGSNWRTDSGTANAQIINNAVECGTVGADAGETGCWSTWVGGEMLTDNYNIQALINAPSLAEATDNFTGIYVAAPTTYSSSSKLVAFVGSTGSGCGLITQTGQPSPPYIANGGQTGQSVVATTTTNLVHGQYINLKRMGNVFTAYINGTQVMTWTDTGNTVPTGAGNRHFGMINEGNEPLFQQEYHSPAIGLITATNIDPQPGGPTTFSGGAISISAGGGLGGNTYNTSGPAARGSGNQTTYNAGGGTGGTPTSTAGTAGGDGVSSTGGAPGSSDGSPGGAGQNLPTGARGVGGGGAGGNGGATGAGGEGGPAGFPGAGGGGGGGSTATQLPGGGDPGSNGFSWIISSNSST